jgi:hypothetical protein
VIDGLAMAAAVAAGSGTHSGSLGLGTALAVILHKPFGALAIATLMVSSRTSRRSQCLVNLVFALVTPLGTLAFFAGAGHLVHSHPAWVGAALAFCAGTFLCIAGADLLPELQFHAHDRVKLSLALLAGVAVAVLIVRFGHAHPETAARDLTEKTTLTTALQTELATAREQVAAWETALKARNERIASLTADLTATRQRLAEAIAKLKAAAGR